MLLTELAIKSLKSQKTAYRKGDGGGLALEIREAPSICRSDKSINIYSSRI
jgi:hypothetical protein